MNRDVFVFRDAGGRRWQRAKAVFVVVGVASAAVCALFFVSLLYVPSLRPPKLLADLAAVDATAERIKPHKPPPAWLTQVKSSRLRAGRPPDTEPVALGFHVGWDPRSLDSFRSHHEELTHVVPEWFSVTEFSAPPAVTRDEALLEAAREAGTRLLPLLRNSRGDRLYPEVVEHLARASHDEQEAFFVGVTTELAAIGAVGVLVDFEEVDPSYRDELTQLFGNFAAALHREGLELWLSVPVGNDLNAFDLDALSPVVDYFVALLFDENGERDEPGPIASQPWWRDWFEALVTHGQPEQWVIGLGTFGYDWPPGGVAETISFPDAMARASVARSARIPIEPPLYAPRFSYRDGNDRHTVWFLDAVTFRNQLHLASGRPIGGIAIYRLGLEDPGVWDVLGHPRPEPAVLARIDLNDTVANVGRGDFLSLIATDRAGARTVRQLPDGNWGGTYDAIPAGKIIAHRGGADPERVALSFDDGPDPEWTPRILDILAREHVTATFFLIGTRAADAPDLVQRILDEGHDIGNHSYWHSDLSESSREWTELELNANRRLLEGITGYTTLLFRPPYHAETGIRRLQDFVPLLTAQELGYVVVNESIDSEDWNEPTAAAILARIKINRQEGNVVLLHDGGGNRAATVRALPKIIRYLRARGDAIVPLRSLVGLSREALLQPTTGTEPSPGWAALAHQGLQAIEDAEHALWYFAILVTALLLARSGVMIALALLHRRAERRRASNSGTNAPVSVILAAYNEEKVLRSTLAALLRSDYGGPLEVVVVDDGSTDGTAAIVEETAVADPRVRLIRQPNAGKAVALQRALAESCHERIVTLDADTQFAPHTIRALVEKLDEPGVGAVAGYVRVGNRSSWLGRCQALEYLCGSHLDRRAYDHWNCITVVPGAVSAFRRAAVDAVGGILGDTLAEDTDLTLRLHRDGWRVCFAPDAIGDTEAPETVRALMRQRVRWAFGTLQCLWKHRDMVGNSRYGALGLFSLPGVAFCHFFLVATIPLIDGLLLGSLFFGAVGHVYAYVVAFSAIESVLAMLACRLAGEKILSALLVVPMRFVYRPVLCIAVWRSIFRAIKGAWYGWGKLDRRGTVAPPPLALAGGGVSG
jgi:peptidoglycan-N-acetylglucosamine deacetylase